MSDVEDLLIGGDLMAMADGEDILPYEDDQGNNINKLAMIISNDNRSKGFYDDDEFSEMVVSYLPDFLKAEFLSKWTMNRKLARIALIHSELSESVEGIRKDSNDSKLVNRSAEEVELADALIRILDYAGAYGSDLGGATVEKLMYNRSRPYKHGKLV